MQVLDIVLDIGTWSILIIWFILYERYRPYHIVHALQMAILIHLVMKKATYFRVCDENTVTDITPFSMKYIIIDLCGTI